MWRVFFIIKHIAILIRIIIGYVMSFSMKNKDLWIILERGYDAQDNAWHFFKYMCENQKDYNVKFAIDKSSLDYKRNLKGLEDLVLDYSSINYFKNLYSAKYIVSTHLDTDIPRWLKRKLRNSILCPKAKIVFLQHGVIHNHLEVLHYPKVKVDLFITGAKREYDLIKKLYGYPEGIVKYTGLARYDNLINNSPKNIILIMPTWRMSYRNMTDDEFKKTEFYRNYIAILSDNELKTILKKKKYKLNFYNHYEFQKFNHLFKSCETENIHILSFGERNVQELLKESKLLITDYSSIYYDFLYMNKSIIFFIPDYKEFRPQQYGEEYDNFENFGQVSYNHIDLKEKVISSVNHGCVIEHRYSDFAQKVFLYRDTNNCERIFSSIIEI